MDTKCDLVGEAVSCYRDGLNCAQSILTVFGAECGIEREMAKRITSSFGGGMCQGDVCGAVAAAIMVIGLRFGDSETGDFETKKKVVDVVQQYSKDFKDKHESMQCRELLPKALKVFEETQLLKSQSSKKEACVEYVKTAAEILEECLRD